VLVVEDAADVRGLFRAILESAGARVRTAESAPEALDAVRSDWPTS